MVKETFNYFFFEPINFDRFIQHFGTDYNFTSSDDGIKIFDEWLISFYKRASNFYKAQYYHHQQVIERAFCVDYKLPAGQDPSNVGLCDDWISYSFENGLDSHFLEFEHECGVIQERDDFARNRSNIPTTYSAGESVEYVINTQLEIANNKRPSTKVINKLWFDLFINNSGDVVSELRKLPYKIYLKTAHWKRIRAAMMFIHGANCQAEMHYAMGESWYFGSEPEIDVHHLNYRNKGNERYSDLALLCNDHHWQWHADIAKYGEPSFEILDADWH